MRPIPKPAVSRYDCTPARIGDFHNRIVSRVGLVRDNFHVRIVCIAQQAHEFIPYVGFAKKTHRPSLSSYSRVVTEQRGEIQAILHVFPSNIQVRHRVFPGSQVSQHQGHRNASPGQAWPAPQKSQGLEVTPGCSVEHSEYTTAMCGFTRSTSSFGNASTPVCGLFTSTITQPRSGGSKPCSRSCRNSSIVGGNGFDSRLWRLCSRS